MPDTSVVYFDSTMTGAPALSGTAGTLIGLLDACLQDGFGGVTLDSLVVASNVATATYSSGHGFAMMGNTGPVILIAGATPAGLNGKWRVTVTSTTQFTFATSGISNQTASGTITAKRAPAGFTKVYSGTNKAAYRADNVQSTRCYLRVDDSTSYSAACIGYQSMSDIDTGTDPFPSSSNFGIARSRDTSGTARPWVLIADDRLFYLYVDYGSTASYYTMAAFGDIRSRLSADAYHCLLAKSNGGAGGVAPSYGALNSGLFDANTAGLVMPRSYTQIGTAVAAVLYSTLVTTWGNSAIAYPDAVNNDLIVAPILVCESTSLMRGTLPGLYAPLNVLTPEIHKTIVSNIVGLTDRDLILLAGQNANFGIAFDLTGPWR